MGFSRMLKRNAFKKRQAIEKAKHRGERFDVKIGKWVEAKMPIRKYEDRKIERHLKRKEIA